MFPLHYVEVPKGGVMERQRIVVTHMFLYEQEKKLFSIQLLGFLQV